MKKNGMFFFVYFILLVILSSCIPQGQIQYLQVDAEDKIIYDLPEEGEIKIKPGDKLLIKVTSFDDINFNFFQAESRSGLAQVSNELSLSASSYYVNDSGAIYFPILGYFKLSGMTLKEATLKMESSLSPYFDQPNVIMKFAFQKIAVLGAVNNPGYHTFTKQKINVFEALSLADDVTIHGNLKNASIIRNENDKVVTYEIDLTKDDFIKNGQFYLKPDDVLYIRPRNSYRWNTISVPLQLTFTTITTAILVLNYVN